MEWISVKDKLPEKRKRVLASDGELVVVAWIGKVLNMWEGWQCIDNEYFGDVTHWMPLPEPPCKN